MTDDILAIVGSVNRYFTGSEEAEARGYIRDFLLRTKPSEVISGGAPGVDEWAIHIAKNLGIRTRVFHAAHLRWEPDGFKERNREIAETCTMLLRIAHRASATYGSGWTRDEAERLGKSTIQRDIGEAKEVKKRCDTNQTALNV